MIRRLGYQIRNSNGTMDFSVGKKPMDTASYSELTELTSVVYDLQPTTIAYGVVESNHRSVHAELATQQSRFDVLFADNADSSEYLFDCLVALTCRVTNFLSSVSAFLDQTGAEVARKNAKEGDGSDEWTLARHKLHDERFSYQLLYQLRHYAQHYALPLKNLNIKGKRPKAGGHLVFRVGVRLQRDALVNGGFDWKHAGAGILAQPKEFDLLPLIDEHMNSIGVLYRLFLEAERDRIAECGRYLDTLVRLLAVPKNAEPVVFVGESQVPNTPPGQMELIPVASFRRIARLLERLPESE